MITANFHDVRAAEHRHLTGHDNDSLSFVGASAGEYIVLFVPPHVSEHTAAAFNRAMQAVPDTLSIEEAWAYTTKSGIWHITCPMPRCYIGQHENVTGDEDPGFYFAQSDTLIGCMDAIDDIETEERCTECHALVGTGDLHEVYADRHFCTACLAAENERLAGLQEMADDDRAHAMMERNAE
jgi:hypothetical protein